MLDFIQFLSGSLHYVLIIAGIAIVLWSCFDVSDLLGGKVKLLEKPNLIVAGFGAFLTVTGLVIFFGGDQLAPSSSARRLPKLKEKWSYIVHKDSGEFSHKGECNIIQEGNRLWINGTRMWQCEQQGGQVVCSQVNAIWHSEWAEICDDRRVRFSYFITLPPNDHVDGFCNLSYPTVEDERMKLEGHYRLFSPIPLRSPPVVERGRIMFSELKPGEKITPPTDQEKQKLPQLDPIVLPNSPEKPIYTGKDKPVAPGRDAPNFKP